MTDDERPPGPASHTAEVDNIMADIEYGHLLRRAETGALYPADFQRIEELMPLISPHLRAPFDVVRRPANPRRAAGFCRDCGKQTSAGLVIAEIHQNTGAGGYVVQCPRCEVGPGAAARLRAARTSQEGTGS